MENRLCCNYQLWKNQIVSDSNNFIRENSQNGSDYSRSFDTDVSRSNKAEGEKCNAAVPDYVRILMVTDVCGRKKQLQVPAALDLERPKRPRTTFTEKQLETLEREFEDNHFVSEPQRKRLSEYLGLSQTQIKVWFQNRRTKYRRMGEALDQDRGAFDYEFLPTVTRKMKRSSSLDGDSKLNFTMTYDSLGPRPRPRAEQGSGIVPVPLVVPELERDRELARGQGHERGLGLGPGRVQLPLPLQLQLLPLPLPHHLPVWPPPPVTEPVRVPAPFQVPVQVQAKSIT